MDFVPALGVVSFAVVLVSCLAILWPRREWRIALGADVPLEDWAGDAPCGDNAATQAFIARTIERNWTENKGRIDTMLVLFQTAAIALGTEVVLWSLALAERG